MKIIFNRQAISAAITPLMCAVAGKSTLSAVEGILIEARADDTCVMTTFDLEKGMRITVNAKVIEEGSYIINAQKFSQTMKVMNGEEVTLSVDDKLVASLVCGKSSHKMSALAAEDFPQIPKLTASYSFSVSQKVVKERLSQVMYAMGVNDQRYVLNGCFMKVSEDGILMVSCDSFKLAKCLGRTEVENRNEDAGDAVRFSYILPAKTVSELYRLLSDEEEDAMRIFLTRKNIVFVLGEMIFFSRLIEGEYIDYDRIIVQNHKLSFTVDKDEFLSALERAALITEERIAGSVRSHVKLDLSGDVLKILATSSAGSTYDELNVAHEGDDLVIAFNNRYLIDSVRACRSDTIKISMSSALTSINIEPANQEEDKGEEVFMLLPVRMKE